MSGGVDSSVAAYLTLNGGYRCEGVTMRLYRNEDIGVGFYHTCCSQKDIDDAADVAFSLDIPYEVLDFTLDFKDRIIEKFIRVYEAGGTPNPCIDCNRYMKFDRLFSYADSRGLNAIVTGHYARTEFSGASGRYVLKKALDGRKDQSYVLYMLTQEQLSRIRFPLGGLKKEETRRIAERLGFCNAKKRDSQDICFVPDGDYAGFMERYTGKKYAEGSFLDIAGNEIGKHRGSIRYTIGQRKGLGIAAGEPVYVVGKNMEKNTVTVGKEAELFSSVLYADEMNWLSISEPDRPIRAKAKIRYRQAEESAAVYPCGGGRIRVVFDEPQRAISVGQAVVLYDGDLVLGGGTITEVPRA